MVGLRNNLREEIINYWACPDTIDPYPKSSYMKQSSVKHKILQDFFHRAGVTFCEDDEHREHKIVCEDYGIAGKIDLIVNFNKLKALGAKTQKEYKPEEKIRWIIGEIKETGSNNYKKWKVASDLSEEYRSQGSIYSYYMDKKGLISFEEEIMYILLCRDDPNKFKTIFYKPDMALVNAAFQTADTFWEHIRNRTVPGKPIQGFKDFTEECIETQKDRKWNHLSGVKKVPEQMELF